MSRNPWFCHFIADILGRQIRVSGEPELTALGCGQLAARGAGGELPNAPTGKIIDPRPIPAAWVETFRTARESVQKFGRR